MVRRIGGRLLAGLRACSESGDLVATLAVLWSGGDDQKSAFDAFGKDAVPHHSGGSGADNVLKPNHLTGMKVRAMVEGPKTAIAVIDERPVDLLMNGLLEGEHDNATGIVARFRSPVVVVHGRFIG
jgi:hypothetical protein